MNASDEREVLGQSLFEPAGAPFFMSMLKPACAELRRELASGHVEGLRESCIKSFFLDLSDILGPGASREAGGTQGKQKNEVV